MPVELVTAALVLLGTGMQMYLALRDIARNYRAPLQHKVAEDELIGELPRLQRFRARREFIKEREPAVHAAIREAFVHLGSWSLLFAAAVTATFSAAVL